VQFQEERDLMLSTLACNFGETKKNNARYREISTGKSNAHALACSAARSDFGGKRLNALCGSRY
jgi:hypothetical protein